MQIEKYIKGDRRGKEANRLEREAMNDPFLQDALEGFDTVPGDHSKAIERLSLKVKGSRNRRQFVYWSAAATILLIIGFGAYFLLNKNDPYIPAFVTLQTKENESKITSEFPVMPSELGDIPDTQTMEIIAESKHADQAALAPPAVTSQRESTVEARANMPDDAQNLSAQTESLDAESLDAARRKMQNEALALSARTIPSQTRDTAQQPLTSAERQEVFALVEDVSTELFIPLDSIEVFWQNSAERLASNAKFGEKEFQDFCRQKADKNACNGKKAVVRVSFFIDESGKPTQIKYIRFTCEKAKEEIEILLSASPVWTNDKRKVTMTIRW